MTDPDITDPEVRRTLNDDRLAWLAIKPYIVDKTRPSFWWRLLGTLGRRGAVASGHEAREIASEKRTSYAFAVGDAVQELSREDRAMLRRTGQVPDWFIARVEELRGAR
jgi:hypothetical protein